MIMPHPSNKRSLEVAQSNFLNYIKMLDGTKKPLSEHLFNKVFHDNVTGMVDGHYITRTHLIEMHSYLFENGWNAKIAHLKPVGKCSFDVKIQLQDERGDGFFVRKLITIRDGKIANSMEYTATLASSYFYLQDSSRKLTETVADSTIAECTTASATKTGQRNQVRRYFMETNAAACQVFKKMTIRPKQSSK